MQKPRATGTFTNVLKKQCAKRILSHAKWIFINVQYGKSMQIHHACAVRFACLVVASRLRDWCTTHRSRGQYVQDVAKLCTVCTTPRLRNGDPVPFQIPGSLTTTTDDTTCFGFVLSNPASQVVPFPSHSQRP